MSDNSAGKKSSSPKKESKPRPRRVKHDERERQIVDEAIRLFAEAGFSGEMRELARRLGVNQSVVYRFFENKEALIERVYQEVFIMSWNPYWEELLENRDKPLLERLSKYYVQYSRTVISHEWSRIFLYAGLRGERLNLRFIEYVRTHVSSRVAREFYVDLGLKIPEKYELTDDEFEVISSIHADIFYIGVRKFVFNADIPDNVDSIIEAKVFSYYHGARAYIQKFHQQGTGESA